jgi:hypothetical protein
MSPGRSSITRDAATSMILSGLEVANCSGA